MIPITIALPLPPKECSPNYHGHWRARSRAVGTTKNPGYRQHCAFVYRIFLRDVQMKRCRVDLLFLLPKRSSPEAMACCMPADESNARASFKAGQDALQDAGVIPTDSRRHVTDGDCTVMPWSEWNGPMGRDLPFRSAGVYLTLTPIE